MSFNADITNSAKFTRIDTNKSVEVIYNPSVVPPSSKQQELMKLVLMQKATKEEQKEFGILWQDRVKKILIDNFDNKEVISVL